MLAFWGSAMELAGDDTSSVGSASRSVVSVSQSAVSKSSKAKSSAAAAKPAQKSRPVSKLRPSKAITVAESASVTEACQKMASKRGDAALVVAANGVLCGILTDTDVARRVLGKGLDPQATTVSQVMTRNPSCVHMTDGAMDALCMMVEGRFRHLPVTDAAGDIVGVLDIAKCLYDAISCLEKAEAQMQASQEGKIAQVQQQLAAAARGLDLASLQVRCWVLIWIYLERLCLFSVYVLLTRVLCWFLVCLCQALLAPLREKTSPTLGSVLSGLGDKAMPCVESSANVRDAADVMLALHVSAVMVMEEGRAVGILTTKDILSRVVSKGKSCAFTCVSNVMTPNPDSAPSTATILEAMHRMHGKLVFEQNLGVGSFLFLFVVLSHLH